MEARRSERKATKKKLPLQHKLIMDKNVSITGISFLWEMKNNFVYFLWHSDLKRAKKPMIWDLVRQCYSHFVLICNQWTLVCCTLIQQIYMEPIWYSLNWWNLHLGRPRIKKKIAWVVFHEHTQWHRKPDSVPLVKEPNMSRTIKLYWGIPSSDGIPYGLADFFFFFFSSVSFRRQILHSRRPNTMKEILYWPGILGKPSYR